MHFFLWVLCPFLVFASPVVDQILSEMSLEEKIGQLFVAPICPLQGEPHRSKWLELFEKFHIGNAILKQSDPETQIECLNGVQNSSQWPLLVLADAEWGLGMRMSGTISFPRNMTLGAIQDLSLLERLGEEIAREARLVGVHMNLAPVVDINSNPKNPVIHTRSFGDNPQQVAERGARVIRGLRKGGIYTCPKHFPGHGDTAIDSHFGLPKIDQMPPLEPFKRAIEEGTSAIMPAHILVPSLDPNTPATLSFPIITSLLRRELNFSGLVVTDALNMKALTAHFSVEEIACLAHAAGADLLLYGDHISSEVEEILNDQIPRAYQALLDLYRDKPVQRLDESVRRILHAKEAMGLFEVRTVGKNPNLNKEEAIALKETLFQEAITQQGGAFPPIDEHTAYLSIGREKTDFLKDAFANSCGINLGGKKGTRCASEAQPNQSDSVLNDEDHSREARPRRKIDLAKPQQAGWPLFTTPVNSVDAVARSSPLSRAQVGEIAAELPHIDFRMQWIETRGDKDRSTSLRDLEKTDFFTRELDEMVLQKKVRVAIHSAKDLPDPIPAGLRIAFLSKGVDPRDCLVLREGERLRAKMVVATSSKRREDAVRAVLEDVRFIDLRGTIGERLAKLERGEADGVVVAAAALIRLKLFVNCIYLPGPTIAGQGRLALVCREDDNWSLD